MGEMERMEDMMMMDATVSNIKTERVNDREGETLRDSKKLFVAV